MIYYEFSEYIVDMKRAPAPICCHDEYLLAGKVSQYIQFAERVYLIEGNVLTEIKNRRGAPGTMHISDEDKVVLKLKAVLI